MNLETIQSGIFGLVVADALGVPVEFQSRASLEANPVVGMRGAGTYQQACGTWSDDSSLTLALVDALADRCTLEGIAVRFCMWLREGRYTPHGEVFDVGMSTSAALRRFYDEHLPPAQCGGNTPSSNGNGSLMRILPMAFALEPFWNAGDDASVLKYVHAVSSVTHAHPRSCIGCGIYIFIALELLGGKPLRDAIPAGLKRAEISYGAYGKNDIHYCSEFKQYARLYDPEFFNFPKTEIGSSGYVVATLEAALWSLWNTENYAEAVLKAVNLGEDTDTVGAVAGGLAGLAYGLKAIPAEWIEVLARREYINELCTKLNETLNASPELAF